MQTRGRNRASRPYRVLRRWARHTPNGEIAIAMLAVGVTLIFVALVLALVLR